MLGKHPRGVWPVLLVDFCEVTTGEAAQALRAGKDGHSAALSRSPVLARPRGTRVAWSGKPSNDHPRTCAADRSCRLTPWAGELESRSLATQEDPAQSAAAVKCSTVAASCAACFVCCASRPLAWVSCPLSPLAPLVLWVRWLLRVRWRCSSVQRSDRYAAEVSCDLSCVASAFVRSLTRGRVEDKGGLVSAPGGVSCAPRGLGCKTRRLRTSVCAARPMLSTRGKVESKGGPVSAPGGVSCAPRRFLCKEGKRMLQKSHVTSRA